MRLLHKTAFLGFAIIAVPILKRFLRSAGTPPVRKSKGFTSVASLNKVLIGGVYQWVLERSENINNPVILFLHGGPGTSQLGLNRKNTRSLEKNFTVVNWDQRDAGKSYHAMSDVGKMNIEQFVQDTRELTVYLLKKYKKQKIVLVAHSWGSVIGILAASRFPELFYCYVGIGQISNMEKGELSSYDWTLEQARIRKDKRAVMQLEKMGRPPYLGDWQSKTITQRSYVARYGGEIHNSRYGAMMIVINSLLFSREYNFKDCINFFRGIFGSMKCLWPELMKTNLFTSVKELKIPVYFVSGKYDQEVPSSLTAAYFSEIKAPEKELIWFEHSAHMPNTEERERFNSIIT